MAAVVLDSSEKEVMPWLPTKTHTKSAYVHVRLFGTLHYENLATTL